MRRKSLLAPVIPAKLREAREARGLTLGQLKDAIGVSVQAISQFETGRTVPSDVTMAAIMDVLSFPLSFFITPRQAEIGNYGPKFFRSRADARKIHQEMVMKRDLWLTHDIFPQLSGYIKFPSVNLPESTLANPGQYSDEQIEEAAANLRVAWKIGHGPIVDLVALMELNGIIVARIPMGLKFDALSFWYNGRPFIMLAEDKGNYFRSRFDAAHEIGHLVLHPSVDFSKGHRRDPELEREADRFASAFLMPRESFGDEVFSVTLDGLLRLKNRWRISVAAMLYRCKDIGYISEYQSTYLWKQLNRRGWRFGEPLDNEYQVERPILLRRAFELIVEHKIMPIDSFLDLIPLPLDEIEAICGVSFAEIRKQMPAPVLQLIPRNK